LFEEVFPPVALMQRGMVEGGLRLRARLNSVLAEFGIRTASGEPEIDFGRLTVRTGRRGRKPSQSPSPAAAAQRRSRAALADRQAASPTNGLAGGRPRMYATDEERRAAMAATAARYRKRKREGKPSGTAE
jgi:secreted protein with Ig-like and vWFA domain